MRAPIKNNSNHGVVEMKIEFEIASVICSNCNIIQAYHTLKVLEFDKHENLKMGCYKCEHHILNMRRREN